MILPTGYYKVLYRPETQYTEAMAIGFMLPHTFENLNLIDANYEGLASNRTFWSFASRIDLIEQVSGVTFPGVPENLKSAWGDEWFFDNKTGRNFRRTNCTEEHHPQGFLVNSSRDERIEACTVLIDQ